MDLNAIYDYCKNLGCCDLCCLRYMGVKCPNVYGSYKKYLAKYQNETKSEENSDNDKKLIDHEVKDDLPKSVVEIEKNYGNSDNKTEKSINYEVNDNLPKQIATKDDSNEVNESNGFSPPSKKRKMNICCSCLGVLQEDNWQESCNMVKESLDKKLYESKSFACALSAPIATLLRERAITLRLEENFPGYEHKTLTVLKEAWKWSYGIKLGTHIKKTLDSGAISPLLVTVNMDYADDIQELEILKSVSPQLFEERNKQKRRFATEFTRRSVEQALERASLSTLLSSTSTGEAGLPPATAAARPVSVVCVHAPAYLAGRYIKLSRNLPQSPWILNGKRCLPSSVQEIIYAPLARLYKFDEEEADRRFKIIAAGREDVDVRCLGDGRPFAIEITDPIRQLSNEELAQACEEIGKSGDVIVKQLVVIKREDLTQLKKGEETKSKTYEALCIKLTHSKHEDDSSQIEVTAKDIELINKFAKDHGVIQQRTPIRVLHRRPLLTRTREILELTGEMVPNYPQLFRIFVKTTAGTYVKEWVHGELGRTQPSLGTALSCKVDLLALDVTAVHLEWPPGSDLGTVE